MEESVEVSFQELYKKGEWSVVKIIVQGDNIIAASEASSYFDKPTITKKREDFEPISD